MSVISPLGVRIKITLDIYIYIYNSKSAVHKICNDIDRLKAARPIDNDMDTILEIGRLQNGCDNVNPEFKWVRSHQEKRLNIDKRLNHTS